MDKASEIREISEVCSLVRWGHLMNRPTRSACSRRPCPRDAPIEARRDGQSEQDSRDGDAQRARVLDGDAHIGPDDDGPLGDVVPGDGMDIARRITEQRPAWPSAWSIPQAGVVHRWQQGRIAILGGEIEGAPRDLERTPCRHSGGAGT